MRGFVETMVRFIFVIIGLIVMTAVASQFMDGFRFSFEAFVENLIFIVKSLIFPENLTVSNSRGYEYSMFTSFWDYYNIH